MTQVLGFGFPSKESLRCEAPACEELATSCTTFQGSPTELFSCQRHHDALVKSQGSPMIRRFEVLTTPGERNVKEEPKPTLSGLPKSSA